MRPSNSHRSGFTLLELLVVVAILLVLLGLGFAGYTRSQESMRRRNTGVSLTNASALLSEREAVTGKLPQPLTWTVPAGLRRGDDFWTRPFVEIAQVLGKDVPAPLDAADVQTVAIPTTDLVIKMISAMPTNKDRLAYVPTIDAWGHRMILVGGSGLRVQAGGQTHVVLSPTILGSARKSSTEVVEWGRPFWASAGPDGDFSTGDDNLYSFDAQ